MIDCIEKTDEYPLCPHCNETLTSVWYRELSSIFGKRYIYFCSKCRKVLGVSHRKGFWMGWWDARSRWVLPTLSIIISLSSSSALSGRWPTLPFYR